MLLFHQPLLQAAGNFLAASDPLRRSDAVIAIGGDGEERVRTAASLLRQGHGRVLIVSGGPGSGSRSADHLARWARRYGVAEENLLLDPTATTTTENAEGSAALMRAHGLRSAILVTSPYHMRRAAVIFRDRFRPLGMSVRAFPVPDSFFRMEGWWRRPPARRIVLREYLELVAFWLRLY